MLAIFAFHLGLAGSPGGFVGVDVFFVISGFVITRGVLLELDQQRFSLQAFYLRRARRILPALIVTLLGTLCVGSVILSPSETREFAGSALASLVSAANVFFHDRTNYFADAAHYRPLLHTWSLSLEEQFYLLFPLILGVLVVRARQPPARILASLVALSLAWCVVVGLFRARHAFYMPMARFWELGAGALIACAEAHRVKVPRPTLLGLAGLGGIAASVALLDGPQTPTWMMLGPVAAAAAVILSGTAGEGPVQGLLSTRTVVAIGRLSYAIYLLHWPVIVFWRMCVARPLNGLEQVAILIGVLVAAQLLWRFVEKPFRAGSALPNAAAMTAIGAGCAAVVGLGLLLRADRASLWTLSAPARESVSQLRAATKSRPACSRDATWLSDAPAGAKACRWSKVEGQGSDLVIWGDSHAGALAPELVHELLGSRDLTSALLISMPHCPPLKGVSVLGPKVDGDCESFVTAVLAAIAKHKPKLVVVAGRWAQLCLRRALARRRRGGRPHCRCRERPSHRPRRGPAADARSDRPRTPSTSCSSARCPNLSTMHPQRWCGRCAGCPSCRRSGGATSNAASAWCWPRSPTLPPRAVPWCYPIPSCATGQPVRSPMGFGRSIATMII